MRINELDYQTCLTQYRTYQAKGLRLNMSRGKPNAAQLALSEGLLNSLSPADCFSEDGTDCRNYGGVDGILEMRRLFGEMLEVSPDTVMVGGNSSLSMMFDSIAAYSNQWQNPRFICPAPGYDRHFAICEYFGIEMLPVAMTPTGPDMDAVEALAADSAVKGMWCVPVFSNPQGYVYSDETIQRLAAMPAAADFRLFWDNAYTVHHFRGERPRPLSIAQACARCGNENRPLQFTSFSKISFAGAAVAAVSASSENLAFLRKRVSVQTVGPDKLNQLRHVRFFKNIDGVLAHMEKHARLLRPKFERVDHILQSHLSGKEVGEWHCPDGGYFLSFDTLPGCAKRTVALCREAGVEMTEAGATFPYKQDPLDRNIRIAPSLPSLEALAEAMEVFCAAVQLAAYEQYARKEGFICIQP